MYQFLTNNREELISRCKEKVAKRPRRAATAKQLENGVPLFLEQLTQTLQAEDRGEMARSVAISGRSGGDQLAPSEMGVAATAHGKQLLELGFTIDQVVHDYGDLCQAITDLAVERDAPFAVDEFRTLNRCLDNAIADAVTEFSLQRDTVLETQHDARENERLGFLVHELRNAAGTATLAVDALERGNLPISGATGGVLKRSMSALTKLIDRALVEVRLGAPATEETFSVATFMLEARGVAELDPSASRCRLSVTEVDPALHIRGNRDLLLAALGNLIQNAFKFTHAGSQVTLRAYADGAQRVLIEVEDRCGGLPPGSAAKMFSPFAQSGEDKSGLGLGLSIARKSVEADGGAISVRDLPGKGCVFTLSLPQREAPAGT